VEGFVPNGVFATNQSDRWIALSCRTDQEWAALAGFLGRPAWATREGLETAASRQSHQDEIEEQLGAWLINRDRDELFHGLQAAGVTAGPVLNAKEAGEDPHLAATGTWKRLPATDDYPEVAWLRPAYRFSKSNVDLRDAPCLFGEHNDYVYRELLGLSEAEIEKLRAEGHIAETFAPEALAGG
jgi:crotonobetainyl-CoA:carnitine CoA-transferase CaiB-like acyl-CoA transferase